MKNSEAKTIDRELLRTLPLPHYADDADKADYGKLLVIAGSARLPGAAILAARAALRCGCGTVRVAAPASVATAIGIAVPELMVIPLPETRNGTLARSAYNVLEQQFKPCDAAVIGPGLDEHEETNEVALRLIKEIPLPLLIDAQALTALAAEGKYEFGSAVAPRVLTPHAAEMSALYGEDIEAGGVDREQLALRFAAKSGATVVLKGRDTLIASPSGDLYKNTAGTRGMGTAGSGDVLAGAIGGLLAQGMEAPRAAVWGVHLHALAGEAAQKDLGDDGMMSTDFLERLPGVVRYLRRAIGDGSDGKRAGLRP